KELEKTWLEWEFQIDPNLVILEGEKGESNTDVVIKELTDIVLPNKVYTVYEFWHICPKTLRRSVELNDARISTYAHPSVRTQFSKLASLACSAMPPSQDKDFCFVSKKSGIGRVLGFSASMLDDTKQLTDAEVKKPLGPIEYGELTGITKMSLSQFDSLIPESEERHPVRGILETSLTHQDGNVLIKDSVKYANGSGKNKQKDGCADKRSNYWQYGLKPGFDFKRHGLWTLLDNTSFGHVTVARSAGEMLQIRNREWVKPSNRLTDEDGPFLPEDAMAACQERDGPDFDAMLQNVAFSEVFDEELETMRARALTSNGDLVVTHPKVAAYFQLLDFRMEATAEPQPIQTHLGGSQEKVYSATVALYHANSDSETQELIETIEEADYELEKLDCVECESLMEAMHFAWLRITDYDVEGAKEQSDALEEGRDVLIRYINDSLYQE
ncbi:MAG: hypothetical protein SGILL_009395, partial [Bacillariaceae sp.]